MPGFSLQRIYADHEMSGGLNTVIFINPFLLIIF